MTVQRKTDLCFLIMRLIAMFAFTECTLASSQFKKIIGMKFSRRKCHMTWDWKGLEILKPLCFFNGEGVNCLSLLDFHSKN